MSTATGPGIAPGSGAEAPRNRRLTALQPYPFERLSALLKDIPEHRSAPEIRLSLGEPRHPAPDFLLDALADRALLKESLGRYPATRGTDQLRAAQAHWLNRRFHCAVDPATQVLPVAGTREALFAVAQALLPAGADNQTNGQPPTVRLPNPFYQIYEGAAVLAGASIEFYRGEALSVEPGSLGTLRPADWASTDLLYLCSPGNPSGQVWSRADLEQLVTLANEHDFVLVSDECYSEIYSDPQEPPCGLLDAAATAGYADFSRCLVFNSLSKRSNLPGLRSGLVAGDGRLLQQFLRYRTYQGCALPMHTQTVSTLAWSDEAHVEANRTRYQRKLRAAASALAPLGPFAEPAGGFFFWMPVSLWRATDDQAFTRALKAECNIEVLPGSFLARQDALGSNPGTGFVRVAWVADEPLCVAATARLAAFRAAPGTA